MSALVSSTLFIWNGICLYGGSFREGILTEIPILKRPVEPDIGFERVFFMVASLRSRHSDDPVKGSGKIVDAGKAALSANLREPVVGAADQIISLADAQTVDIFIDRVPAGAFENLA